MVKFGKLMEDARVKWAGYAVCHVVGDGGFFMKAFYDITNDKVFSAINMGGAGP